MSRCSLRAKEKGVKNKVDPVEGVSRANGEPLIKGLRKGYGDRPVIRQPASGKKKH